MVERCRKHQNARVADHQAWNHSIPRKQRLVWQNETQFVKVCPGCTFNCSELCFQHLSTSFLNTIHMVHLCPSPLYQCCISSNAKHQRLCCLCQVSVLQRCLPACCEQWSRLRPSKKQAAASQLYMSKPEAKTQYWCDYTLYANYGMPVLLSTSYHVCNSGKQIQGRNMGTPWLLSGKSGQVCLHQTTPELLQSPASPKPKARRPPSLINVLEKMAPGWSRQPKQN